MQSKVPFCLRLNKSPSLAFPRKKIVCPYPKCSRKYKTKPELNHHYNYRHKQKSSKTTIDKCSICNKTFQRTKYLKEHMKIHVDDLPFNCSICGEILLFFDYFVVVPMYAQEFPKVLPHFLVHPGILVLSVHMYIIT